MKKYLFLLFSIFVFCSCASLDNSSNYLVKKDNTGKKKEVQSSRNNVNLFKNWEIPAEFKRKAESKNSVTERLIIYNKTKTYKPAEKIFVEIVQGAGGGGFVYVASKRNGHGGYNDRHSNFAFFIDFDYLYNGQEINVLENEEVKQIGEFSYKDKKGAKTIPVVILVNNKTLPLWKGKMQSIAKGSAK